MNSDEMSDLDFARYEANVKEIAWRKNFVLIPTTSPRRYLCASRDPPNTVSVAPEQSLEQIEVALRLFPDVWPWSGERRGGDD